MPSPLQLVDDQPRSEREESRLRDRLQGIVSRLATEAEKRVGQRYMIEQRWLRDLEQFHGRYDADTEKKLAQAKKSALFINQTRAKTNAMEARVSDMLFPTDDKNWGIEPTPVPELAADAQKAAEQAIALAQQAKEAAAGEAPGAPQMQAQADAAGQLAAQLKAQLDEARKRAKAMEAEIEDQLAECRYAIQARDVIRDACRLGAGIMKGPLRSDRAARRWVKESATDEAGRTVESYTLAAQDDRRPSYHRVDPWGFFPDMDATTIEDCGSFYERHLKTPKAMRDLAKRPAFDKDAIRRLLRDSPRQVTPQYLADIRQITSSQTDSSTGELYEVWEYHGPLTAGDMRDLAHAMGDEKMIALMDEEEAEDDPLVELHATLWFCQGEVLMLGIHPLDSGEPIYSVFCLEKDDSSVFGYGIPYIMRDAQKALNAAWRMMMDNSGLSTGPQIVVNKSVVEPADGSWDLVPNKIWWRMASAMAGQPAFETYNIESHQAELAGIITLAMEFIDTETAIPLMAQGDGSSKVAQTAHGMSILQNAVNVVFRRVVKNFDDDMTEPNIRRLYHWNMQFSDKEHIKGDYEVDARGTSVLLVREIQSQNLMVMASNFSAHPVLGPITKAPALYRRLMQSMMLPADEVVMTDDELREAAASQPPQPDVETMKLEAQMNIEKMRSETALQVEQMRRDTEMMKLSSTMNLTLDQIRAQLQDKQADRDSKERIFAAEVAVEERQAARNPGDGNNGSGGYISQ